MNSQSSEDKREQAILIEMPNLNDLQGVFDKAIENNNSMIFLDQKGNVWQLNLHNELLPEINKIMTNEENTKENEENQREQSDEENKEVLVSPIELNEGPKEVVNILSRNHRKVQNYIIKAKKRNRRLTK